MRAQLVTAVLLVAAGRADAHIAMTSPAPRTVMQKEGPCGELGGVRGGTVATFAPGDTITIEWDETVDHPGHYRISFDEDGQDFVDPARPDDNLPTTLVDQIDDLVGPRHYTQEITLPSVTCTNCTLQLIQIMGTTVPYNSFYYQCVDLVIADDGGGGDDEGGGTASGGCAAASGCNGLALVLVVGLAAVRRKRRGRDTSASRHRRYTLGIE